MPERVSEGVIDQLFREARSHNAWTDEAVPDSLLHEIIDIMKMGPTSANSNPARVLFLKSDAAKQRLLPCLDAANREKTKSAPVCAIIAHDMRFHDHLPQLFPHTNARGWFEGKDRAIFETAFRNGTLQGAYFMIAARMLGLDVGAMSGFGNEAVDAEFFPDGRVKSNFLCNIGYGDPKGLFPRLPRFGFDELAQVL